MKSKSPFENKTQLENAFKEKIDKNFDTLNKYFENDSTLFSELNPKIFEVNKCLILECFTASITLTNHILERLLKLALITNDTGIGELDVSLWDEHFEKPHKDYSGKTLGNTIELCLSRELITTEDKDYLFNKVREQIRNGFSHSDTDKILVDNIEYAVMFQSSFKNPTNIKPVKLNIKNNPIFQAIQMENFAKENALKYFDFVYNLISKIELRIHDKNK